MQLIINADDLGYNRERDQGIFECFLDGRSITSASVLANSLYGEEALRHSLKVGLPVGLHFNLSEGRPLNEATKLTSLTQNGTFLGKLGFVNAVKQGCINEAEVALELRSQIEWYRQVAGSLPVHVDGHQHVHVMPAVRKVFCEVLVEYGILWTRLPSEDAYVEEYSDFLKYVIKNCQECKCVFACQKVLFPAKFVGLSTMGTQMTIERLRQTLTCAAECAEPSVTCELMAHPGYPCTMDGGCGVGPDNFSKSRDREHEMEVLRSKALKKLFVSSNINLISYLDL